MNVTQHTHPSADRAAQLHAALEPLMDEVLSDLTDLVAIPSIAWPAFDPAHVRASAEAVAGLASRAGFEDVEILTAATPSGETGAPAVVARRDGPEGAPTVVLYATTTSSPRVTRSCGTRRRSRRPSAATGSSAGAPQTTRPASSCT